MKLKNKKTGEITEANDWNIISEYNSLAELEREWEDYEEPKKYYYIPSCGEITHRGYRLWENESVYDKKRKEIGNYFETKEEAEKAVEKLKAWKRLKDKGFEFIGKTYETDKRFGSVFYKVDDDTYSEDIIDDLDLLFGGEE